MNNHRILGIIGAIIGTAMVAGCVVVEEPAPPPRIYGGFCYNTLADVECTTQPRLSPTAAVRVYDPPLVLLGPP